MRGIVNLRMLKGDAWAPLGSRHAVIDQLRRSFVSRYLCRGLNRLMRGTYDTSPSTTYAYRCKCWEATAALWPVLTTAIPAIGRVARAERELAAGTTRAPHTRAVANPPAANARARLREGSEAIGRKGKTRAMTGQILTRGDDVCSSVEGSLSDLFH
jgi:hypothetical protein